MNSTSNELMNTFGHRMGISNKNTLSKAGELQRLLGVRGASGLTTSAAAVVCLRLAATDTGEACDKSIGVKLSGLSGAKLRSKVQVVGRLLGVDHRITIHDLSVTHSILAAEALAVEALALFTKHSYDIDTQQPLYQAAALLAACKPLKLKPDKKKLLESSGAQKKVFDKAVEQITEIASQLIEKNKVVAGAGKNGAQSMAAMIHDVADKNDSQILPTKRQTDKQEQEEDYAEWKRKILEEAQD